MSDINYTISLRVAKGFLDNSVSASGVTADMAQTGLLSQTLTLSTNAVNISTASLSGVGLAYLRNLSTATLHTAAIGVNSGGSFVGFCTLRAGEPAVLRLTSGIDYQAKGAEGARLRVDITEG